MTFSARREAIEQARFYLQQKPLYLDTETTGTGPHAEIVEISIVDHDGTPLLDTLVRPRGAVEAEARRVHGISDAMLQDAPPWEQVWPQVKSILQGQHVGIYNLDFDLRLMQQSCQRSGLPWRPPQASFFCIMRLYAQFYAQWDPRRRSYRWQSLDNARAQCGLNIPNSHRALDDTLLARAVLHYMAQAG